jgi:hypothetical protein
MLDYARAFGYAETRTDLEEFCDLMTSLDGMILDHSAAQQKAARDRTTRGG